MKKTCNNCRALCFDPLGRTPRCDLGYAVRAVSVLGVIVEGAPLEECPKPRTYEQHWDLLQARKKESANGEKTP